MKTDRFSALLESFFTERLIHQRQASPHTISSYRDTFRLLLQFAQRRLSKQPSRLALEDIDAPMVTAFLDDLESSRKIGARSRNLRLTAIRSFFHFAGVWLSSWTNPLQSGTRRCGSKSGKRRKGHGEVSD